MFPSSHRITAPPPLFSQSSPLSPPSSQSATLRAYQSSKPAYQKTRYGAPQIERYTPGNKPKAPFPAKPAHTPLSSVTKGTVQSIESMVDNGIAKTMMTLKMVDSAEERTIVDTGVEAVRISPNIIAGDTVTLQPTGPHRFQWQRTDTTLANDNGGERERKKRKVLTMDDLMGDTGIPLIVSAMPKVNFLGTGYEREDCHRLVQCYREWLHRLHPKISFSVAMKRIETFGSSRRLQHFMDIIRHGGNPNDPLWNASTSGGAVDEEKQLEHGIADGENATASTIAEFATESTDSINSESVATMHSHADIEHLYDAPAHSPTRSRAASFNDNFDHNYSSKDNDPSRNSVPAAPIGVDEALAVDGVGPQMANRMELCETDPIASSPPSPSLSPSPPASSAAFYLADETARSDDWTSTEMLSAPLSPASSTSITSHKRPRDDPNETETD